MLTIPIQSIFELAKKPFKFLLTKNHLVELVNYVTDSLSKSVIARYNDLELAFPDINQSVPQYMIANYLGVSQAHLSRLKSSRNSLKK